MTNARPEFYITGGTLPGDALCYVPRQADTHLHDRLTQGEYCYVLTGRQMGKSSLMVRTAQRLRREEIRVAVLDLSAVGQNLSVEQWYWGLIGRMGRQLGIEEELEAKWLADPQRGSLQRWIQALEYVLQQAERVVIFIDEVDVVRSLPFSADEFFAAIRECYNRRMDEAVWKRLTFCLLGVARPSDLIRDARLTPFNIGHAIELTDFTLEEAAALAPGLESADGNPMRLLERVLYWTGGHPYLTQRLCHAIAAEKIPCRVSDVDAVCHDLFLTPEASVSDDNLQFVHKSVLFGAGDPTDMLMVYQRVRAGHRIVLHGSDPVLGWLRISGLIRIRDRHVVLRNRIYAQVFDRDWIRRSMPDAEVRRQKAAFFRGLVRASILGVGILALTGGLAATAFYQWRRAEGQIGRLQIEKEQGRHLLYIADMNLAQQALEKHNVIQAGELLEQHRDDPWRGFEWELLKRFCHLERFTLSAGPNLLYTTTFSPDSRWMATGGSDGAVRLWEAATGKAGPVLQKQTAEVTSVAFSPDGKWLAASGEGETAWVWNTKTRQAHPLRWNGKASPLPCLAFSPDSRWMATGGSDGAVRLWEAATGKAGPVLQKQASEVVSVAFSPDGKWIAASGKAGLSLLDTQQPSAAPKQLFPGKYVYRLAFSPDGKRLGLVFAKGQAGIWERDTQTLRSLPESDLATSSVAFSPNGRWLGVGSVNNSVRICDALTGEEVQALDGHTGGVQGIAFSPDGHWLATCSFDRQAKLWELTPGQSHFALQSSPQQIVPLERYPGGYSHFVLGPEGRLLAAASEGHIRIWETATGHSLPTISGPLYQNTTFTFSGDGTTLVMGAGETGLRTFTAATGAERANDRELPAVSHPLAVSRDEQMLVTGRQGNLTLWKRGQSLPVRVFPLTQNQRAFTAAFSPDGTLMAAAGWDRKAHIWEVATGVLRATLQGHKQEIRSVAFSADGKMLVTGSADATVKLWDIGQQRELLTLPNDKQTVEAVSLSPDNRTLTMVSVDGTVRRWHSTPPN